ncbi:MAG: ImmA/IrrE family metallo-endopeptidase, partial [Oscillospiraceae bacterium]
DIMDYAIMRVEGGTMFIEATLLEDDNSYGRLRFTLAHELAHYIIHKQIFSGTGVAAALYNDDTDEDATEWQANYLAKAILMPNGQIKRCFYALLPKCKSKSEYVGRMSEIFEVSKQAMEIRLKDFALI